MSRVASEQPTATDAARAANVAFFDMAFRPLFWLGALFSVTALTLWVLQLNSLLTIAPYGGSYAWHQHEMLFGFFAAIVAGFLLTAVQNWTARHCIGGVALALLVAVWALARVAMLWPQLLGSAGSALLDWAFLPLAALVLARPLVQARQWRNLFFVPLLLLMALLNGLFHLSVAGAIDRELVKISHSMVLLVAVVMTIMGGRVIPMFSANGTNTPRVAAIVWLERVAIASVFVVFALSLLPQLHPWLAALSFAVAAVAGLARAIRWRLWVCLTTPLVWSLQLSYLLMAVGLLLLASHAALGSPSASMGYHMLTVGGMGLMILSMICRVALGHTGRPIVANGWLLTALLFMLAAALVRTLGAALTVNSLQALTLAAIFWVLAYSIFIGYYAPIVFRPRVAGR